MFKLVIQDDEGKTTVVPLIRDEITIGRKEGNTIRLTERNVSRRHARILRNNGDVQIEDLGSYNGIRVNNARIAERVSLRVSDQVQIGDYKLYLKAEGAEQVDEARTMPIERVENVPPTEVMPAIAAPPNGQLPVVPTSQPIPQPLINDPGGGRPVATAAQVAALTAPAGYGKLVVVSSNFAGKVYDLSMPQMIVGRTDDNQIVINHRSISRNHAKVTRDPETSRYTISDLQSSNGVRVNGQDYGKVELRRGDEVDLGHVRLRFVEPGEDFVFERDARIADIAESGGGRGLMMAIVFAVLLLAAAGGYFLFAGKSDNGGKTGSNAVASGSAEHVASGTDPGSNTQVVTPNGNGSETAEIAADAAVAAAQVNGSGSGSDTSADDQKSKLANKCQAAQVDKKWDELLACSKQLAPFDKTAGAAYAKRAQGEQDGEQKRTAMATALGQSKFGEAKRLLTQIPADTDAKEAATSQFNDAATPAIAQLRDDASKARDQHKCDEFKSALSSARKIDPSTSFGAACEPLIAERPHPPPNGSGSNAGSGSAAVTQPPKTECADVTSLHEEATQAYASGNFSHALDLLEQNYKCNPNPGLVTMIASSACKAHNTSKVKQWYGKVPAQGLPTVQQQCIANGVSLP